MDQLELVVTAVQQVQVVAVLLIQEATEISVRVQQVAAAAQTPVAERDVTLGLGQAVQQVAAASLL